MTVGPSASGDGGHASVEAGSTKFRDSDGGSTSLSAGSSQFGAGDTIGVSAADVLTQVAVVMNTYEEATPWPQQEEVWTCNPALEGLQGLDSTSSLAEVAVPVLADL